MEYPSSQNQVMFQTPKNIPIYLLSDVTQNMKVAVLLFVSIFEVLSKISYCGILLVNPLPAQCFNF